MSNHINEDQSAEKVQIIISLNQKTQERNR